jgi:hypothetical protein
MPPATIAPVTVPPSEVPATPTAASASPSESAPAVQRDDSLLGILPGEVEHTRVVAEETSFDEAARDPAFAEHVERAAFAVVSTPTDLASGVVAQLRPGLLDEAFLADWRETYDEGACAQAGGVATNAETTIGGRTVYITTCAGGLTIYHTAIPARDVIVSLLSIGEGRFGEQLMAGLRP